MKVGDLVKYHIDNWEDDDCEVFLVVAVDGEWATILDRGVENDDYVEYLEVVSESR